MKRLLSLVLALVLLVSVVSMSFAAVTVGGNARFWYKYTNVEDAGNEKTNGFTFDRVALTLAADITDVSGFKGELQFRTQRSKSESDIRVDTGYYYQKSVLSEKDELDIGQVSLPFVNGAYSVILQDSLANVLWGSSANSVGIKYGAAFGQFDFAAALVGANNTASVNNDAGMDYSVRANYAITDSIKVGAAYVHDVDATTADKTDTYKNAYVVDSNGSFGPVGYFVEYLSLTPTENGDSADAQTGIYFEGNCKLSDALSFYAARAISLSDDNIFVTLANSIKDTTNNKIAVTDNWTAAGVKVQMAKNVTLQGEYTVLDGDKDQSAFGARFVVKF